MDTDNGQRRQQLQKTMAKAIVQIQGRWVPVCMRGFVLSHFFFSPGSVGRIPPRRRAAEAFGLPLGQGIVHGRL